MSFDLVVFGGTGDLTWRKLMPALFQAFRHGKLPEGGRILAVSRQAMSDDDYRAWLKERFQEVEDAKRPDATRSSRASPACCTTCASTSPQPGGLRAAQGLAGVERRPRGAGRRRRHVPRHQPRPVPDDLRPARRRRPERRHGPGRAREAARPRPGERARDQPRRPLGVPRGAGVPHRPLPRQAGGAEPDGAALRQRPVRAALAARVASPTSRSRSPKPSASARAATSTTAPARCAT